MTRSWVFSTLQLALLSSTLVEAGTLHPIAHRENHKQSQEDFDHNTASLVQQGQCREYLGLGHTTESTSTCENKCGDMVKKAEETGNITSVGCMGLQGTPTYTDPKGDDYMIGRCLCDPPIVDFIFHEVLVALPAIAEIGCSILFGAFDLVLEVGAAAIPGVGEMTVGMKAGIQAAKTITENGQDASSFIKWFDSPCGHSKYTDMVDKIFNPLSSVPDDVVPGLGCKGKKCPGKNDDKGPKTDKEHDQSSTRKNDQTSTRTNDQTSTRDSFSLTNKQTQTTETKSSGTATKFMTTTAKPSTTAAVTSQITTTSQTSTKGNGTSIKLKLSTLPTRTTSSQPLSSSTDVCKLEKAKRGDDLNVRTVNQLHMSRWKGNTYTAFDPVRQPIMNPCVVRRYAERGYVQINNLQPSFRGVVLVSALFIPNLGVFVGSKPRGANGNEAEVTRALYDKASQEFPPWPIFTEGRREPTASTPSASDYYHAEDQVLIDGGAAYYATLSDEDRDRFDQYALGTMSAEERNTFNPFPPGTYIVTWGRYRRNDPLTNGQAGVRPPCEGDSLSLPCQTLLQEFKIPFATS